MRAPMLAALPLLLITTAVASGADVGRRMMPPPMPAPARAANWSGFYLGLNGGGGIASTTSDFDVGGVAFGTAKNSLTGALGGAQIGYNWQAGVLLLGLEADFQLSGQQGSLDAPCPPPACAVPMSASFTQKMPWFGTVRARLGLAAPTWLAYATGGYAYARLDTDAAATAPGIAATLSQDEIRNGWTVGGGLEVGFSRNWSARLEYLYLDLGSANTAWALTGLPTINDSAKIISNIVRAGVNYRF
jgi:outer membrane immunogenic protein